MDTRIFKAFEKICSDRNMGEKVLEVGAVPSESSLLNMKVLRNVKEKVGINLDGPYTYKDFHIIRGNANAMDFDDAYFDTVLCNAVFEHDKFFGRSISEIRRVTKKGGLVVIGAPGYTTLAAERYITSPFRKIPVLHRIFRQYANFFINSTITYRIHDAPGDYYRFSTQAFKDVFFENMKDVIVQTIMLPPRIIGAGMKS